MLQVYATPEEAAAARARPRWSHMLGIIWDTSKRPLLWFFTLVSLLHGECDTWGAASIGSTSRGLYGVHGWHRHACKMRNGNPSRAIRACA